MFSKNKKNAFLEKIESICVKYINILIIVLFPSNPKMLETLIKSTVLTPFNDYGDYYIETVKGFGQGGR